MRIVTVRRISQVFFLLLFLWFCIAATVGQAFWQLRGWPINWFLELDPLTALATVLSTGTLYANLLWALAAIVLTLLVGRFFCGFVCPLGTTNQFTGWLARRGDVSAARTAANRHRPLQSTKYYILAFLLVLALMGSVQTGLIDPLPLLYRSINLSLAPIADRGLKAMSDEPRFYASAWLLGVVFLSIVGLNLVLPRFFCRFVCPLGALFGLMSRFTPWRLGKTSDKCGDCCLCDEYCEGACRPSGKIITSECVMCFNCMDRCPAGRITFAGKASAAGEVRRRTFRRGFLTAAVSGLLVAVPVVRLAGLTESKPESRRRSPPRCPGGGGFPGALHQVRPVHARLPAEYHSTRPAGGRSGRFVDATPEFPRRHQRLPAQLHRRAATFARRRPPAAVAG